MNSDLLQAGLPPANDRMLTTCFLAALFHGIIILGVTFTSSKNDDSDLDGPPLEVLLVNDRTAIAAQNPQASYLAQRTQIGSGNAPAGERTQVPDSSPVPLDRPGIPGGSGPQAADKGGEAGVERVVATHTPAAKILYFAPAAADQDAVQVPELLEKKPNNEMTPNDDGIELRLRGAAGHSRWIAADTRASDVAVYLDGWRRKVERIGTLNFPDVARRRQLSGTPVIEVTIGADGRLLKTLVHRSSGHVEIDDAAMRILKLAAPYDPFPRALAAVHDEIRIAYEWQFLGGAAQGAGVFLAEP